MAENLNLVVLHDTNRNEDVLPITHEDAVLDADGKSVGTKFTEFEGTLSQAVNINYDNSQSGLAAENVQGALDEIEEKAVVYTPTGFFIPSDSSVSAWFEESWLTTNNRHSFVIPRNPSWQRMKVTANPNYFSKIGFLDNTYTEPINGHSSEFISAHIITAGISEELNIPTNCAYIAVAASPNSTTNTEYLPVGIEMYETNTSHHEIGENISDTTYTYASGDFYKTISSTPIDNYERVRVRVIITNSTNPKANTTLLEVFARYNGVSTTVFRNYGKSIHDADITLDGDKLSMISVGGNMKNGSVARVIIDGYGAMGEIEKLAEELVIPIPNSPSAFIAGNGKWVTRNDNYKGVFVSVLPNTSYRIVGDSDTYAQYAILTSNAFAEGEYVSTYAKGEFLRHLPKGGEDVIVTPEDAKFINVGYLIEGVIAPPTIYKNGMAVINKTISNANNIRGVNQDAVIVAAFNAPASIKEVADFVCDGINDEVELQRAIYECQTLAHGCKIILSSGVFYIDDFPLTEGGNNEGNKLALKIGNNSPISIEGDLRPFSFTDSNRYVKGTVIMVSTSCYEELDNNIVYKIIGSDFINKIAAGSTIDFRMSNVSIKIPWNQKKIIGIDCRSFNRTHIEMVTVSCILNGYNGWNYSYGGNVHYPDIPAEGSIGIRMMGGSNADHVNTYKNIMVQGFYEGYAVGGDDVLMEHCTSYWCVYPYTFGNYQWEGGFCQPIVMISCSQYKCTNLPLFVNNGFYNNGTHYTGNQEVVMIAYHGEHILNGSDAPGGVIGVAAKETTNKMFKGYIEYGLRTNSTKEYRMQSDPLFLFWQPGYGEGFITRNNAHNPACTSSERTAKMKGNYLEKVFDTTLGKEVICIDTENQTWVDANGNVV